MHRAVEAVAAVDIRADGVGQNALRDGDACHLEAEAGAAVADVHPDAARDGIAHRRLQFTLRRQHAVGLAVKAVGDDVACGETLGDLRQIRRVIADMHHQRQTADPLLDRFGFDQRLNAVLADYAAAHARLQADDKAGQPFYGLLHRVAVDLPHIRQLALRHDAGARDIDQRVDLGGGGAGNGVKIIDMIGAGAACVDNRRDARGDADGVRLVVIDRRFRIAVDVRINPACADVAASGQIAFAFRLARQAVGDGGDFAVLQRDIHQPLIRQPCAAKNQIEHSNSLTRRPAGEPPPASDGDRKNRAEDHGTEDRAASDRLVPEVEEQRAEQRAQADRDRGRHSGKNDQRP